MSEITTYEAQTLKQLATNYKIGTATMRKWLISINVMIKGEKRKSYIFTPAEVKTIYNKLGEP